MTTLIKDRLFHVFVALVGITALSWFAGHTELLRGSTLGAALLVLAFIKVRLIVTHYMEAKEAPLPIRLAFEAWVFGVAAITIALYLR